MIRRESALPRNVSRIPFVSRPVTERNMTLTALLQQGAMDHISPMNDATSLAGTAFQLSLTADLTGILIIAPSILAARAADTEKVNVLKLTTVPKQCL